MRVITGVKRPIDLDVRTYLWLKTNEPNMVAVFMLTRSRELRRAILTHPSVNASVDEITGYLKL